MSVLDGVPTQKLTQENFGFLQSLIFRRAHEIRQDSGASKSRAEFMAEDEVAQFIIDPPTSGTALARWMGKTRNLVSHGTQSKTLKEAPVATVLPLPKEDVDDFTPGRKGTSALYLDMAAKLHGMKPGDVWSFPVASEEDAAYLAKFLPKVARRLNWKIPGKRSCYKYQVLPDRLKIKRL